MGHGVRIHIHKCHSLSQILHPVKPHTETFSVENYQDEGITNLESSKTQNGQFSGVQVFLRCHNDTLILIISINIYLFKIHCCHEWVLIQNSQTFIV